jgi:YVTN family beta-propeller protein
MILRRATSATLAALVAFSLLSACDGGRSGPLAYVSNERDGTITVISLANNQVVSTIKIGARTRGIRLSPDGKTVYVAASYPYQRGKGSVEAHVNKIVAMDVASDKVVATYDAGEDPENFVVNNDGTRFYIADEDAGEASIVDVKANKILSSLVVGAEPEGVAISPDGRWVYVTSESSSTISVIDTSSGQLVKTFLVGARPREAIFTPDSSRAFVSAENGGTISVVDTRGHTVVATVRLPGAGTQGMKPKGMALSPDARRLYVATGRGNDVSVIDTDANKVVATVKAGDGPWGVVIKP